MRRLLPALMSAVLSILPTPAAAFDFPDIFMLGDSQLSFGAGAVYLDFFRNIESHCSSFEDKPGQALRLAGLDAAVMGVKSTSIHSWVANVRQRKKMVCEPDPKWPVNARLYGFERHRDGSYVQLGHEPGFPFCQPGKTPFEAMFVHQQRNPRLLVMYFMGNSITRWANAPKSAQEDVRKLTEQLPAGIGCIFMTTSPTYHARHNDLRYRAQTNIAQAFADQGNRCAVVEMITPATRDAIEGQARYFRRYASGAVKDPYHPDGSGARRLISVRKPAICRAILGVFHPSVATR